MAKRKRAASNPQTAVLDPEEAERREQQRKLREVVLKLRAKGKDYHPRHKKKVLHGKPVDQQQGAVKGKIQVVVIPIFWKQRPEEQQRVLNAARAVQQLISEGLGSARVVVDESNVKTPGQKMRAWEERGVKVRVELGPSEAAKGTCVLARAKGVGQVANKQTLVVGPLLLERLKSWLPELVPVEQADGVVAQKPSLDVAASAVDSPEADRSSKKQKKHHQTTTDAGAVQTEDAATAEGKVKKKKRSKAKDDVDGLPGDGTNKEAPPSSETEHAAKKKKRKKIAVLGTATAQLDLEKSVTEGHADGLSKAGTRGPFVKDRVVASNGVKTANGTVASEQNPGIREGDGMETGGAKAGGAVGRRAPRAEFVSGDALEDDFGDIPVEAEEDLQLGKRERVKLQHKRQKLKKKERKMGAGFDDEHEGGVEKGAGLLGLGKAVGSREGGRRKGTGKLVVF